MKSLNSGEFDDGGTPAWRANQATWRVIDAEKSGRFAAWRRAPFSHVLAAVIFMGMILPLLILVVGVLGLAAWDALVG